MNIFQASIRRLFNTEAPMTPLGRTLRYGALWALFAILAGYYEQNVLLPLDRLTDYIGDPAQMVWNLWITKLHVLSGQSPFWTDYAYYPTGANLAHHTLASGYLPLTLILNQFTGSDVDGFIRTYNLCLWTSLTITYFSCYLLAREIGCPRFPAIGCALAFGSSAFMKANFANLNHASAFFLPLCAWLLVRLWRRPNVPTLYFLGIAFASAFYFTETIVYLAMALVVAASALLFIGEPRERMRQLVSVLGGRHIAQAVTLSALVVAPYLIPFLSEPIIPYDIAEHSRYSANLAGFLIPERSMTPFYRGAFEAMNQHVTLGNNGNRIFLGYPLILAAAGGLFLMRKSYRLVAAISLFTILVLALGPALKVFGHEFSFRMPYAWMMDYPPLRGSRTPSRLVVIILLLLLMVAAHFWRIVYAHFAEGRSRLLVSALAVLWLGWVAAETKSLAGHKSPWLAPSALEDVPKGTVFPLPLEMVYGYIGLTQIAHRNPTISGTVVRLSPAMADEWWTANNALEAGGETLAKFLSSRNVSTFLILPSAAPGARTSLHLQRAFEHPEATLVDGRPPPKYFPGTPPKPPVFGEFEEKGMSLPIGAPLMLEVSEPFSASAMEVTITAGVQVHFEFFLGSDRIGVEKIETSAAESNSTPRVVVQGLPSLRGLPFNRVAVTSESERTSPIKIGHLHFR